MATTQTFARWSTYALQQIAFRVTPKGEWAGWVATSEDAENYTEAELRAFVIEQLDEYGITEADVNDMKS